MESSRHLIDTNVVIDFLGKRLPDSGMEFVSKIIDSEANLSVITKMELLGFNAPPDEYAVLRSFVDDTNIIDLSNDIVEATIDLRKVNRIKLPDAIIAATAMVNSMTLITRNDIDFQNLENLAVINPYKLR